MTVIAMTREMGSRGRDVAVGLAEELGLELVQHEVVEHVADKMHMRESSVNRFLEGSAARRRRPCPHDEPPVPRPLVVISASACGGP